MSLVRRSVAIKARVVATDELEQGTERRILNFGHTLGHAIEASSGFELRHGEAVGLGILAALRISSALGVLEDPALLHRIPALLGGLGLPVDLDRWLDGSTLDRVRVDKKRRGHDLTFIGLRRAGECQPIAIAPDRIRDLLVKHLPG
jgi:3-dehydroquinate synthetase